MIQLNSQQRWGARCARCNSALPITLFGWVSDTLQQEASAGFGEPNLGGIRHRSWIWNHAISVPVLYWKRFNPFPFPFVQKLFAWKLFFPPSSNGCSSCWQGLVSKYGSSAKPADLLKRPGQALAPEANGAWFVGKIGKIRMARVHRNSPERSRNVSSYRMASQTISIGECIDA